jgi:branched-subunit amino acid transport protein
MSATQKLWLVIVAVGGLTYLSRLSFIALFARWEMPPLVARALRYVPAAMLTTIVVPAVLLHRADGAGFAPARLVAALAAAAVAWRTRSATGSMVVGMLALWLTEWLLRASGA